MGLKPLAPLSPVSSVRLRAIQTPIQFMSSDHVRGGPDAPIENFSIRIARVHTNDYQHGARTVEMYRSVPERFDPGIGDGQELIAAAIATLVDDGTLETVEKDGTPYHRLAE